ncbi:MAG: hypothetical protein A2Z16_07400 [Chloroflexi bacterium RBG_16_54_18]|nr:MAG: hypothetical protein A2Z16_07400 [Chloroflexi bacterium RBG_16_54_18]
MSPIIRTLLAVIILMGMQFVSYDGRWGQSGAGLAGGAGSSIGFPVLINAWGSPAQEPVAGFNSRIEQIEPSPPSTYLPPIARDTFTPTVYYPPEPTTPTPYYPPIPTTRTPFYPPLPTTRTPYYPPFITRTYTWVPSRTPTYYISSTPTTSRTATPTSTATFTPSPTSTLTTSLLPPEAKTLNPTCTAYVAEVVGQAMRLPETQFLIDLAPSILASVPGEQTCGQDAGCWNTLLLQTLTREYIQAGHAFNPGLRPAVLVINAMARLFDEPTAQVSCHNPGVIAWEMALQFSIKGSAIDAYALHSPANLRVRDFENKESGFKNDGSIQQDIPGSLARRQGESQYIFLPSERVYVVDMEGTADGEMDSDALHNTETVVKDMSFDGVPVNSQTRGNLNLDLDPPVLEIKAGEGGQLASIPPTYYQEYQIQASVAPVTASPTVTPTVIPTPTPTPAWQVILAPQMLLGSLVVCVVGFVIGIFSVLLVQALLPGRKSRSKEEY